MSNNDVLDSKNPEQLKEKPKISKKKIIRLATMGNSRPQSGRKQNSKRSASRKRDASQASQASVSDLQSMAGKSATPARLLCEV